MKKFEVYQVPMGAEYRNYRFASLAELKTMGLAVERKNYRKVYEGSLKVGTLEEIFIKMNQIDTDNMRSMGMGDVIVVQYGEGDSAAYYVDRAGFEEVAGF